MMVETGPNGSQSWTAAVAHGSSVLNSTGGREAPPAIGGSAVGAPGPTRRPGPSRRRIGPEERGIEAVLLGDEANGFADDGRMRPQLQRGVRGAGEADDVLPGE